jgi:photosystem II stability/assembly factor-like uncharacterized protein
MKRIFLTTLLLSLVGLLNLTAQERVYTPDLIFPENGSIDMMPDVILDWNAVTGGNTGIIKYDIQLDTDPAFSSPDNFETEFLTAVQTDPLLFGETYYWHVRAKDGNIVSDWSETWSFSVILRVTPLKPSDASATLENDTVQISWVPVTGLVEYELQFDTVYYWESISSGQTVPFYGISVIDDTHSWMVGKGGLILFYDGTTWTEQESNIDKDLTSVYFIDSSNGWAVSKAGKIINYNGTGWVTQTSGTTNDLNGVYMLDASNGWIVGKDEGGNEPDTGFVMHYDGSGWTRQFNASEELNKVFAVDPTHVWAVGKNGLILFYNGSTWTVQPSGTIKEISNIAFTSVNDGWAIGKGGLILHYKDGTWGNYPKSGLPLKDLLCLSFDSPTNGWAVGKSGVVLQYDGFEWFNQSGVKQSNYNAVGISGSTGFIAGDNGALIKFTNETFTSPMAETIVHISNDESLRKFNDQLFGTQYFWRMRMKSIHGLSEWSGSWSYNTRATVALDKPNDGDDEQNLDQELSWKKQMSDRVSYEIEVDEDPDFGSPIFMATTEVSIAAELLKFGVEYNWRVRALHALDISDWSDSRTFTTINTVFLESPANNEVDVKISPLLTWEAQTGIGGYQAQVSTTNNFGNVLVSEYVPVAENSLIVPMVLDKDAVFYWRVRAYNGLDTSGWSETWSFRTLPPVGIDEPGLSGTVSVYPNPAENTVYIQVKDQKSVSLHLAVTDLVGKKVVEKDFIADAGTNTLPVDVSKLQNGIYILRISDNESSFTKKLVIKR